MMSASRSLLGGIRYRKFVRYQLGPDQPPVVRTEVTAGNSAVGGGFDGGAAFYRDRTDTGYPLIDGRRRYTKHSSECFLASNGVACFFDSVHVAHYSNATDLSQAMLHVLFDSVAI